MTDTTNVLLAGVGGQGVILASEILALAAIAAGYDAKQTEVHGVSQRGGSVFSHVRFGSKIRSPLIKPGQADVVFGMEKLEALRFAHYLKEGGLLLVNDHGIMPVSAGEAVAEYPHQAVEFLKGKGLEVLDIKATELAESLGNHRVANVIMLGALSHFLDIDQGTWQKILRERIPERFLALNLEAFAQGVRVAS
ncbi:MAG: indolepyruvate oxidoreductase subunit beta [Anaerolineae bacterium]